MQLICVLNLCSALLREEKEEDPFADSLLGPFLNEQNEVAWAQIALLEKWSVNSRQFAGWINFICCQSCTICIPLNCGTIWLLKYSSWHREGALRWFQLQQGQKVEIGPFLIKKQSLDRRTTTISKACNLPTPQCVVFHFRLAKWEIGTQPVSIGTKSQSQCA